MKLLRISGLSVAYGDEKAIEEIALEISPGEIVGVVGQSGSGKSTLALAVLGLLPPTATVQAATMELAGLDLLLLSPPRRRAALASVVAYVPQEPMSAFNPTLRVGRQIGMVLQHRFPDQRQRVLQDKAMAGMLAMGISDPGRVFESYPFQLSGGQLQRALLAQAFALEPELILADEPTTALDVTVQAEVLTLFEAMVCAAGKAVLLISHNVGVVGRLSDRVLVMHRGSCVEQGPAREVLLNPRQAYTQSLINALPSRTPPRTPIPSGTDE